DRERRAGRNVDAAATARLGDDRRPVFAGELPAVAPIDYGVGEADRAVAGAAAEGVGVGPDERNSADLVAADLPGRLVGRFDREGVTRKRQYALACRDGEGCVAGAVGEADRDAGSGRLGRLDRAEAVLEAAVGDGRG